MLAVGLFNGKLWKKKFDRKICWRGWKKEVWSCWKDVLGKGGWGKEGLGKRGLEAKRG